MRNIPPLSVEELALVSIGALLLVRTGLGFQTHTCPSSRLQPQEGVEGGSVPAQGVVRRHEGVVDEAVHQDSLFDHLLELGLEQTLQLSFVCLDIP